MFFIPSERPVAYIQAKKVIKEIVCVLKLLVVPFFKINNDVSLEQCEIDPYLESILTVIYKFVKIIYLSML